MSQRIDKGGTLYPMIAAKSMAVSFEDPCEKIIDKRECHFIDIFPAHK